MVENGQGFEKVGELIALFRANQQLCLSSSSFSAGGDAVPTWGKRMRQVVASWDRFVTGCDATEVGVAAGELGTALGRLLSSGVTEVAISFRLTAEGVSAKIDSSPSDAEVAELSPDESQVSAAAKNERATLQLQAIYAEVIGLANQLLREGSRLRPLEGDANTGFRQDEWQKSAVFLEDLEAIIEA